MRDNMPLTREHQLQGKHHQIRAGQGKPSANNPNGHSKKQFAILNFLIEQDFEGLIKNVNNW